MMMLLPCWNCCDTVTGCCENGERVSIFFSVGGGSGEGFQYFCLGDYDPATTDRLQGGPLAYESTSFEWTPTLGDPCVWGDTINNDPGSNEFAVYSYSVLLRPPGLESPNLSLGGVYGSGVILLGGNPWTSMGSGVPSDPPEEGYSHVISVFDAEAVYVTATQQLFSHYFFGAGDYISQATATPGWSVTLAQTHDIISMQRLWQREEPQITLACPSSTGKDAVFTPVFKKHTDGAGQEMWQLESVTVTDPGSGYDPQEKNYHPHLSPRLLLSATNAVGSLPVMTPVFSAASAPASITGVTLSETPGAWPNGNLVVGRKGYLNSYTRSEPTITATAAGGVTLSVTLEKHGSGAGFVQSSFIRAGEYWSVKSLAITDAGKGPWTTSLINFDAHGAVGGGALAFLQLKQVFNPPPSVTLTLPDSGSGAILDYTLAAAEQGTSTYWTIDTISVTSPGDGYLNGEPVTISVPDGYELGAAYAEIVRANSNPNLTAYIWGFAGTTTGTGAVLSAVMASNGGTPETWRVESISILSGGSGYQVGEYVWYSELDPSVASNPPYYVSEIDGWWITGVSESGAITSLGLDVSVGSNGIFYKQVPGPIESVAVISRGVFQKVTYEPDSVQPVLLGGAYYNESVSTASQMATIKCNGNGWDKHELKVRLEARPNPEGTPNNYGVVDPLYYRINDNIRPGESYGTLPFPEPCVGKNATQKDMAQFTRSVQELKITTSYG